MKLFTMDDLMTSRLFSTVALVRGEWMGPRWLFFLGMGSFFGRRPGRGLAPTIPTHLYLTPGILGMGNAATCIPLSWESASGWQVTLSVKHVYL